MVEMEDRSHQKEKYKRAQRQVQQIKKFYTHLRIFIMVNIVLFVVKFKVLDYVTTEGIQNEGFINWFEWNIIGTPILWGIGLLVHGLYVFKFNARPWAEMKPDFMKRWEQEQLARILREEEERASRRD